MFAIIRTGGKQYRVAEQELITVDKVSGQPGDAVQFGEVLLLGGENVVVGSPTISGATVAGELVEQGRGEKVIAFKKRRRKNSRRKRGHRQEFSVIRITEILTEGKKPVVKAQAAAQPEAAAQSARAEPAAAASQAAPAPVGEPPAAARGAEPAPKAEAKPKAPARKAEAKPAAEAKAEETPEPAREKPAKPKAAKPAKKEAPAPKAEKPAGRAKKPAAKKSADETGKGKKK